MLSSAPCCKRFALKSFGLTGILQTMAKEIVPIKDDDKKFLVEIAAAMAPFENEIADKWDDLYVKARNGLKDKNRAVKDYRMAVRLLLTSLSDGNFDGYFRRIEEHGSDFAKTREQYENLILSFHLYEESTFPYLQKSFPGRLPNILSALDHLYHNVIAILARAYFSELEKEREKLLNIFAHDLQNPLTAIIGLSKILMKKGLRSEKDFDYLKTIYSSGKWMRNLIENALAYGRLKSEKVMLTIREIDLVEIAKKAISFLLPEIEEKGLSISINGCYPQEWGSLPFFRIKGDEDLTLRAIGNYLSNATKYARSKISIHIEETDGDVLISVRDDGLGIPSDQLTLIFGDYYQVLGGKQGTGLGLPSVRMIADLHNGKAWAESQYGNASTFYIKLPKKQEEIS